jgi:uncharacterized protein
LARPMSRLNSPAPGNQIVLHYLTERDHPWLRALLDEYERGAGTKRVELLQRLREPLPVAAPKAKQQLAVEVLERLTEARVVAWVPPREARWEVFAAAACSGDTARQDVLTAVSAKLGTDSLRLEEALFADLHTERTTAPLPASITPGRVAAEANLRLVGRWLKRAQSVRITAFGNTRAVVRQARLHGLICSIGPAPSAEMRERLTPSATRLDALVEADTDAVELQISGPLALFRHTLIYGRALCGLVPRLFWCSRFELRAVCEAAPGVAPVTLVVRTGDPIRPGRELKPFDSLLEQRFAKDFRRVAPDWDVIREPRPIASQSSIIFPDFELVHRREPSRRFLLEIVGFWTPKYLEEKLQRLQQAQLDNIILCIDEARACSEATLPSHAQVIRYRRRIDAAAVLRLVDGVAACASPTPGTGRTAQPGRPRPKSRSRRHQ